MNIQEEINLAITEHADLSEHTADLLTKKKPVTVSQAVDLINSLHDSSIKLRKLKRMLVSLP